MLAQKSRWKEKQYWRDYQREYMRKWRATHKEHITERNREYWKTHPEKKREKNRRYAERLKLRRQKVLESLGRKCYICGQDEARLELHHKRGFPSPYTNNESEPHRKTIFEAEKHPERFVSLCHFCHIMVTFLTQNLEQKERLLSLL